MNNVKSEKQDRIDEKRTTSLEGAVDFVRRFLSHIVSVEPDLWINGEVVDKRKLDLGNKEPYNVLAIRSLCDMHIYECATPLSKHSPEVKQQISAKINRSRGYRPIRALLRYGNNIKEVGRYPTFPALDSWYLLNSTKPTK